MSQLQSDHMSLATALDGSPVTIFRQERDGGFLWFENPQSIWIKVEAGNLSEADVFTHASIKDLKAARARSERSGEPESLEVSVKPAIANSAHECVLKLTLRPVHEVPGDVQGFLCTSVDVSAEKQREQTLRTLLLEVAHRSKNMLAMVMGLASQTARSSTSIDAFLRSFNGRVQSLAKSQNAVTESDWSGARFSELVKLQVADVIPLGTCEVSVSGDDPEFKPAAALHIGLALHELVTNALVSGALLDKKGRISVRCSLPDNDDEDGKLAALEWIEEPGRSLNGSDGTDDFAKAVLERVVPAAVSGEARFEMSSDSTRYRLTIATTELHA